jgi:hypothetical protein
MKAQNLKLLTHGYREKLRLKEVANKTQASVLDEYRAEIKRQERIIADLRTEIYNKEGIIQTLIKNHRENRR